MSSEISLPWANVWAAFTVTYLLVLTQAGTQSTASGPSQACGGLTHERWSAHAMQQVLPLWLFRQIEVVAHTLGDWHTMEDLLTVVAKMSHSAMGATTAVGTLLHPAENETTQSATATDERPISSGEKNFLTHVALGQTPQSSDRAELTEPTTTATTTGQNGTKHK